MSFHWWTVLRPPVFLMQIVPAREEGLVSTSEATPGTVSRGEVLLLFLEVPGATSGAASQVQSS